MQYLNASQQLQKIENVSFDEVLNVCYEIEMKKRGQHLFYDQLYEIALNLNYESLLNFCSTNKKLSKICQDSTFWERRKDILMTFFPPSSYKNVLSMNKRTELFIDSIFTNLEAYHSVYFAVKLEKSSREFLNRIIKDSRIIKNLTGIVFKFEYRKKILLDIILFSGEKGFIHEIANKKEFTILFFTYIFTKNVDLYELYIQNDCTREIKLNTKLVSKNLYPCVHPYQKGPYSQVFDLVMVDY